MSSRTRKACQYRSMGVARTTNLQGVDKIELLHLSRTSLGAPFLMSRATAMMKALVISSGLTRMRAPLCDLTL